MSKAPAPPEKTAPVSGFFDLIGKVTALQSFLSLLAEGLKNLAAAELPGLRASAAFVPGIGWILPLIALFWVARRLYLKSGFFFHAKTE